jgi:HEAT repeat protein
MRRILISLGFVFLFEVCSVCVYAQSASIAPTRTHIDALIHDLQDKATEVRIQAAKALYGLEAKAAPAAKALVVALGDREYIVREFSRNALAEIGPPAIPHLAKIINRDITSKRMLALGRKRVSRPSAASVRREVTLKRLLMHGRQKRLLAFEVCSRIGDGPPRKGDVFKGLTPVLFASLSDKDPFVRVAAIRCLWGMGEASCVPQLIKMLEKDKDVAVRHEAVMACITFENKAVAAIPVLARMVVQEYDTIYDNAESLGADAVEALSGIGEPALPALAYIVADDKQRGDIRCKVLSAMRNMTSHAKIAGNRSPNWQTSPSPCRVPRMSSWSSCIVPVVRSVTNASSPWSDASPNSKRTSTSLPYASAPTLPTPVLRPPRTHSTHPSPSAKHPPAKSQAHSRDIPHA